MLQLQTVLDALIPAIGFAYHRGYISNGGIALIYATLHSAFIEGSNCLTEDGMDKMIKSLDFNNFIDQCNDAVRVDIEQCGINPDGTIFDNFEVWKG